MRRDGYEFYQTPGDFPAVRFNDFPEFSRCTVENKEPIPGHLGSQTVKRTGSRRTEGCGEEMLLNIRFSARLRTRSERCRIGYIMSLISIISTPRNHQISTRSIIISIIQALLLQARPVRTQVAQQTLSQLLWIGILPKQLFGR